MLFGCEKRTSGTANWSNHDRAKAGRVRGVRARTGGGRFVDIPGFPGERIDRRLLADIAYLQRKYNIHVSDGYARTGHAKHGEHPIGLAVDIVPGPGGSWSDVDRLAKWAEPRQNRPRSPFRWVGYNGDREPRPRQPPAPELAPHGDQARQARPHGLDARRSSASSSTGRAASSRAARSGGPCAAAPPPTAPRRPR